MQPITANTKIAALIHANPDVIDAIASINPHFKKLKNPLLRKILAARVTIADAARIGKCSIDDFFRKLEPLGFVASRGHIVVEDKPMMQQKSSMSFDWRLDVRGDIENGQDPFTRIMDHLSGMATGEVLLLINSFEPTPLIRILQGKHYETEVNYISTCEVHTSIRKTERVREGKATTQIDTNQFELIAAMYKDRMQTIDVRNLPMPQPMITILDNLRHLPEDKALFVHHKKLPLFLLPELEQQHFEVALKSEGQGIQLIIYKPQNS